jgi:hypothetical protein
MIGFRVEGLGLRCVQIRNYYSSMTLSNAISTAYRDITGNDAHHSEMVSFGFGFNFFLSIIIIFMAIPWGGMDIHVRVCTRS